MGYCWFSLVVFGCVCCFGSVLFCVVLFWVKVLKVVFVCVSWCFFVSGCFSVFRSCSDCLKLSQVIGSSFWLCELCGMVLVLERFVWLFHAVLAGHSGFNLLLVDLVALGICFFYVFQSSLTSSTCVLLVVSVYFGLLKMVQI